MPPQAPITVPLNVSAVVTFSSTLVAAPIGIVQQAAPVGAGTLSISLPNPTTAGNCVVVIFEIFTGGGVPSISGVTLGGVADNFAATVTKEYTGVSDDTLTAIWVDEGCAGGQTAIVVSGSNLNSPVVSGLYAYEVSGLVTTSVVDKTSSNATTTVGAWTSNATATTSQPSEIWFGGCCYTSAGPASPWINNISLAGNGCVAGYQIVSTQAAATYANGSGGSTQYCACVVTLKGAQSITGIGTAQIGPRNQRELWYPQVLSVSASSAIQNATCYTYAGPDTTQPNFVWSTKNGSSGDSTASIAGPGLTAVNLPGRVIHCGEYVFAVWAGGDAGAQGRLNIQGMKVMNSGGPPGWTHARTRRHA